MLPTTNSAHYFEIENTFQDFATFNVPPPFRLEMPLKKQKLTDLLSHGHDIEFAKALLAEVI
jgi:hypothetical protein